MVLFPEAQRRAQKEIDTVVGSDRLPGFSDRPSLPFVEAVLQETLRWHPVATLGELYRSLLVRVNLFVSIQSSASCDYYRGCV